MRYFAMALVGLALGIGGMAARAAEVEGVAEIQPTKGNEVKGTVRFIQLDGKVKVVADIVGLKPNSKHGFHIHEGSECGEDGMKAGGHYNPEKKPHGGPGDAEHHAGDMGNLEADADGKVHMELTIADISVNGEKNPVVNRSVMVHADPDDLKTQPTGNSGKRIGCGIIKVVEKK